MTPGASEFEEWQHVRLPNWGRSEWAALMASGPDASCANPIYDMGPRGDPEGYADDDESGAAVAPNVIPHPAQYPEVDEADAEVVGGWIAQIPRGHRAALVARYVMRLRVDRDRVNAAIRAVLDLKHDNRRAVMRVQGMLLRWGI